ncbi:hypothetical protein [Bowmanella denitrificans]|uniref:hypothetical protein n=1 Tax=Bowmanella denitrificans TaxID=366582 RepID=UPI000C999286|nr:hypothetical protein [Bowmanella denitrificans]
MKTGSQLIADERQRQIDEEGRSAELDDAYKPGTLTTAAICYATVAGSGNEMRERIRNQAYLLGMPPNYWPWDREWWKPGQDDSNASRIRELTKAGALLAAEIDRLQRKSKREAF